MRTTVATGVALAAGAVIRAGVSWWTEWGEQLVTRTELAPPTDRLDLLRETVFLAPRVDPIALWSSLTVHHSPLLLAVPSVLINNAVLSSLMFIGLDVLTAAVLAAITSTLARRGMRTPAPAVVAALYMLHPYAIACAVAKSLSVVRTLLTATAALCALRGYQALPLFQSLNMLLFFVPAIYMPLLMFLGADSYATYGSWRSKFGVRRASAWTQFAHRFGSRTVGICAMGILVSAYLARDPMWWFVRAVYGTRLLIDDLAPALGLAWYFFVEIFGHFRQFFTIVVNAHLWAYMVPVTLVFRNEPLFGIMVLSGLVAIFQNYPSAGDTALFMSLWSIFSVRLADNLRHPMVTALLFAYAALLLPIFHYLWLYAGSANANFYFAAGLVHCVAVAGMLLDGVWAWSVEQWEHMREKKGPSGRVRRRVVQT